MCPHEIEAWLGSRSVSLGCKACASLGVHASLGPRSPRVMCMHSWVCVHPSVCAHRWSRARPWVHTSLCTHQGVLIPLHAWIRVCDFGHARGPSMLP